MNQECMICMEEPKAFVPFPCGHEVCEACFPKVMTTNPECPLCRRQLAPLVTPLAPLHFVPPNENCNCFSSTVYFLLVLLVVYIVFTIIYFFSKAKE